MNYRRGDKVDLGKGPTRKGAEGAYGCRIPGFYTSAACFPDNPIRTLIWNFYVSMANWVSTAADYTFTGLEMV